MANLENPKVKPDEWHSDDGKRLLSGKCRVVGRCYIEGRVGAVVGLVLEDDGRFATYWVSGPSGGYYVVVGDDSASKKQDDETTRRNIPLPKSKSKRRSADD